MRGLMYSKEKTFYNLPYQYHLSSLWFTDVDSDYDNDVIENQRNDEQGDEDAEPPAPDQNHGKLIKMY